MKVSHDRLSRMLLLSVLLLAFCAWVIERFLQPESIPILHNIVVVVLLIGVVLGFFVFRRPRQIQRTGDTEFDDAIGRMMDEEARQKGDRQKK